MTNRSVTGVVTFRMGEEDLSEEVKEEEEKKTIKKYSMSKNKLVRRGLTL